jgi:hypothetical protein
MSSLLGGGDAGKDQLEKSNDLMQENIKRLEAIGIPSIDAQKIVLESPELVGLLEAEQQGPSAMEGISTDPRLRQSQMRALEEISGLGQTGLGVADKAAFNELRRDASAQAQAQNAAALQGANERGMLDSGSTLAAQLMAGQQQANRASAEGDRIAAAAAEARRAALMQQGQLSSSIRGQDYGQQSDVARARDSINAFNAQNRQNVNAQNLSAKQGIANQRVANNNTMEQYNKGLIQQNFQNQMSKAGGVNAATGNLASSYANQGNAAAQAQANQTAGLIGLAGTVGGAMVGGPMGASLGGQLGKTVAQKDGSVDPMYDKRQMEADLYGKGNS